MFMVMHQPMFLVSFKMENYRAIAFVFENNAQRQPVRDAVVSVNDVEALIGYDLFTNLDDRLEESIESQANWDEWTH